MHPKEYIKGYDRIPIGGWYKDKFFWRKKSSDGSDGKGDLIFNTCYRIRRMKDKSEWAYHALQACSDLLNEGRRWPERMWDTLDAESWIERIIVRSLKHGFNIRVARYEFRYVGRMVRDSFTALYNASVLLGVKQYIIRTPMPWYVYSPEVNKWRRRLIKDERDIYKRRLTWLRADAVTNNEPQFADL